MSDKQLIGALEAGGTKMVVATGYADGTIVEQDRIPTTTPEETCAAIIEWFKDKDIEALGVGAFGPTGVNPKSDKYGYILETPKTAWRYFDFLGTLKAGLNVPCGYDTDVNVACLGEAIFGGGQGLDALVYLTIGTGIGAGVMLDGKLVHGMLHPEAGHLIVARDPRDTIGEHSGCPYHDSCLEGLVAGPSIAKRWDGSDASYLNTHPEALDMLAGYLAQALEIYVTCYSPQRIIIGGGVADNTDIVKVARAKAKDMLNGYIVAPELEDWDTYVINNTLDGKQGIMGCLALGAQALQ